MGFFEDAWNFVTDMVSSGSDGNNNNADENEQGEEVEGGYTPTDLLHAVMNESYAEANEDLRYFQDKVSHVGNAVDGASETVGEVLRDAGADGMASFVEDIGDAASKGAQAVDEFVGGDTNDQDAEDAGGASGSDNDEAGPKAPESLARTEKDWAERSESIQSDGDEVDLKDELKESKPVLLDAPVGGVPSAMEGDADISDADFAGYLASETPLSSAGQPSVGDPIVETITSDPQPELLMASQAPPAIMMEVEPEESSAISFQMDYMV